MTNLPTKIQLKERDYSLHGVWGWAFGNMVARHTQGLAVKALKWVFNDWSICCSVS